MRLHRTLLLGLFLLAPTLALAANPHFSGTPTITAENNTLTACGSINGLGNADVTIELSAIATVQCINRGGTPPPGQKVTVQGSVSGLNPKNGNLDFCVSTARISNPCPDGMRFTATFSNVTLRVIQNGRTVLTYSQ